MGAWNSRGLRGSTLEEIVNLTNEAYRQQGLALIQTIPTPITPVEFRGEDRVITLAYFDRQSTVDYIGVVQGVPVCFDAKDTMQKSLPLQNIHPHQLEFMGDFTRQGGAAFLLVHFVEFDSFHFLPYEVLRDYWEKAANGGRKSIPYGAFAEKYRLQNRNGAHLNYLEGLNVYLAEKADKSGPEWK